MLIERMNIGDNKLLTGMRSMLFIDGTNFLVEFSRFLGFEFRAESPPANTGLLARALILSALRDLGATRPIRHYWFASFTGNDTDQEEYQRRLRECFFTPIIFKKYRAQAEKRVDIALTTALLVNAQQKNFDIAVLVSGDADYLSVVEEAKRYGGQIFGCFFKQNLNPELEIAFDRFFPIETDEETKAGFAKQLQQK
jgi:NYN domain-containing protein